MTTDIMDASPARARLRLESGNGLAFRDGAGVTLMPLTGRAWLTMEGDLRDIDLSPGVTYRIERDGLTLVNALEAGVIEVRMPAARRASWRRRLEQFWDFLVRAAAVRAKARIARGYRVL